MVHSFVAAQTLAAQRIVGMHSAGTAKVNYTVGYGVTLTLGQLALVGVTKDQADTDRGIPVAGAGEIARVLFNDTVAAGAYVTSDTAGRGIPLPALAGLTGSLFHVGCLIGPAVASTGTIQEILVLPGGQRIS